jgi:hypothetical protein
MRRPLTTPEVVCLAGAGTLLWVPPASAREGATAQANASHSACYKAGGGETNDLTIATGADDPPAMSAEPRDMDGALDARPEGEQLAHGAARQQGT